MLCLWDFKTMLLGCNTWFSFFFPGSWRCKEDPYKRRAAVLRGLCARSSRGVREQRCQRTVQEGSRWRNQRFVWRGSPSGRAFNQIHCHRWNGACEMELYNVSLKTNTPNDIHPVMDYAFVARFHWDRLRIRASREARAGAEDRWAHSGRMPPTSTGAAQGWGGCNYLLLYLFRLFSCLTAFPDLLCVNIDEGLYKEQFIDIWTSGLYKKLA